MPCVPHACLPGAHEVRRASDLLELWSRIVANYRVSFWKMRPGPCKGNSALSCLAPSTVPAVIISKGKIQSLQVQV